MPFQLKNQGPQLDPRLRTVMDGVADYVENKRAGDGNGEVPYQIASRSAAPPPGPPQYTRALGSM